MRHPSTTVDCRFRSLVSSSFAHNRVAIFVGDLPGTPIMAYVLKMLLALMRSCRSPA